MKDHRLGKENRFALVTDGQVHYVHFADLIGR